MKLSEVADLLTMASAYDGRKPAEVTTRAWAAALDDNITFADAKTIVIEHYARTRDWIMPADVNAASRQIRHARTSVMASPQPPEALDGIPERENAWRRAYVRLIGDGLTEAEADARACAEHGVTRPAIEAAPRPVAALTGTHKPTCTCGCLTRPIRPEERRA